MSGSTLSDSISFVIDIEAINSTPFFGSAFVDQSVDVYSNVGYTLPTYDDDDTTDNLAFTIVEDGTGALPVFMSETGGVLTIAPTDNS